jgi:hypothetical protein
LTIVTENLTFFCKNTNRKKFARLTGILQCHIYGIYKYRRIDLGSTQNVAVSFLRVANPQIFKRDASLSNPASLCAIQVRVGIHCTNAVDLRHQAIIKEFTYRVQICSLHDDHIFIQTTSALGHVFSDAIYL